MTKRHCKNRDDCELLNKQALKYRGWTEKLIRDFLGQHDEERVNPRYKCAAPQKLFRASRVEKAEASEAFRSAREAADKRSIAAKDAAENRRQETIAWSESVPISVPTMPMRKLVRLACDHYNALTWGEGKRRASPTSDIAFLKRICVNTLRHAMSPYDALFDKTYGHVGCDAAKDIIRDRVYEAIADAYPDLASECYRQLSERERREMLTM